MSVKDQGLCKVILLTVVFSSAMNDSNSLHCHIYIIKENHVVVPHPLIWIKNGLMKLFWVCFDFIGFWLQGTISSLHMGFFHPFFYYSKCKPWFCLMSSGVRQQYSHVPMPRAPSVGGAAALMPGSAALLGLRCSFSKGSLKSFGCWGAGEAAFVMGVGPPPVRDADSRRQNLLVNVTEKRKNMGKKRVYPHGLNIS